MSDSVIIERIEELLPPLVRKQIALFGEHGGPSKKDVASICKGEAFERFDHLYHVRRIDPLAESILQGIALAAAYAAYAQGGCSFFGTYYEVLVMGE
jgi:hypothetical protein